MSGPGLNNVIREIVMMCFACPGLLRAFLQVPRVVFDAKVWNEKGVRHHWWLQRLC